MKAYQPIPVDAARRISKRYDKHIVVIIAIDDAHKQIHTTTYGIKADNKLRAAELGPILAKAAGGYVPSANYSEDFRKSGLRAERLDELVAAAETVKGNARLTKAIKAIKSGK